MTQKKKVCIVHYNTPELLRACILSFMKQGTEWHFVIFDNSDQRPVTMEMLSEWGLTQTKSVFGIIDNTQGQIIDFDAELAKWPSKRTDAERRTANFGSAKHMMSVDWLIWNTKEPFVLCDSDILLKRPVDDLYDESVTAIGFIDQGWNNPHGIKRLWPMLCWINAPECRRLGIHYYDGSRCWGINSDHPHGTWYDTGAAFLEDIKANKEATLRTFTDVTERFEHLWSGSWNKDKEKEWQRWLNEHAGLWHMTPRQKGINDVAICVIARMEHDYLFEFVEHYIGLGVKKIFIYDNGRGDEPVPQITRAQVEVINWRDRDAGQNAAYNDCYQKHGYDYGWIGFLDADEFVRLSDHHKDIATYLKDVGGHADVVLLNWRIMTDSGLIHKDARPVQQRFTQPMLPLDKRVKFTDIPENDHVKAFVRGGIERLKFADTPHCPTKPADMIAVNSNGERAKLSAFTPFQHRYAWIDHYHTKTAEEFLCKCRRGFPLGAHYEETYRRQAVDFFFKINERTPEKEALLRDILLTIPNTERIMEHVTKIPETGNQVKLVAERGYLLKSKVSGKTYQEISTCDMKRWEVIPDADTTSTVAAETNGKPKTTKRANRKEKK
jgi:hypothetical protein